MGSPARARLYSPQAHQQRKSQNPHGPREGTPDPATTSARSPAQAPPSTFGAAVGFDADDGVIVNEAMNEARFPGHGGLDVGPARSRPAARWL